MNIFMYESMDDDGNTALMLSAGGHYSPTLKILIEHGANVNAISTKTKRTALMCALSSGVQHGEKPGMFDECIQHLLAAGARVDVCDSDGNTAEILVTNMSVSQIDTCVLNLLVGEGREQRLVDALITVHLQRRNERSMTIGYHP